VFYYSQKRGKPKFVLALWIVILRKQARIMILSFKNQDNNQKKRIMKSVLLYFVLLVGICNTVDAQIALAVAKNDNGSSVKYSLMVGATLDEAYEKAQKDLEEQGFENIFVLRSSEETGHNLKSGNYVLIVSSRKNGGRFFVSYGLGVSEKSKAEAIQRAITHLKEWDLGYEKDHGYSIEKEGTIEDFYPKEEEENN